MTDFFRGWRRKLGVVTLVMACVAMTAWLRSTILCDDFTYSTSATSGQIIGSLDRHLVWMCFDDVKPTLLPEFPYWYTEPFLSIDEFYNRESTTWSWRFCDCASGNATGPGKVTIFVVSFRLILIPLTLISVWLLLSKPRKSTLTITEPIPNEGA